VFFYGSSWVDSELVAGYFIDVAEQLQAKGYERVTVLLDRHSTHKGRMQEQFWVWYADAGLQIGVEFVHYAAYSPWMNLVEYVIHWLRQSQLHHAPFGQTLGEVKSRLIGFLDTHRPFSGEQIINILCHIEAQLAERIKKCNLSP
jgi:hypothetical protein